MAFSSSPHPSHRLLRSYGLGELDDHAAEQVEMHLKGCPTCRHEAVEESSGVAQGPSRDDEGAPEAASTCLMNSQEVRGRPAPDHAWANSPTNPFPPGLADHPDYRIIRELGRGGMGVVYLANNRLTGRDEVFKVIGRPAERLPLILDRFLREIRAVAKLRHPNIVAAYTAFRLDGALVFSMEYVEGVDLARLLENRGPLPVSHAVDFAHQVAMGLQHAHGRGTVHRDIKPANLMLSHDGERAVIKILDFGLAKVTLEEAYDGGLTEVGQMLGTPAYAAPEQFRDAQAADIRADIYSLGCTLHHVLAGEPPFPGRSTYDLLAAHSSSVAKRLDVVRPGVPSGLASLVVKMMAKDPGHRFQSAGEVALALAPFLDDAGMASERTIAWIPQAGQPAPTGVDSGPPRPATGVEPTATSSVQSPTGPAVIPPIRRMPRTSRPVVAALLSFGVVAAGIVAAFSLGFPGRGKTLVSDATQTDVDTGGGRGGPIASGVGSAPQPAWVPLFNGKDLHGWTCLSGNSDDWMVVGGVIRGASLSSLRHSALGTTRSDFADFRLRMELRSPNDMNKMIVFRSTGSEPDISNYRFFTGGVIWNGDIRPAGEFLVSTGSSGDVLTTTLEGVKALTPASLPAQSRGAWREVEVIARGNTFRLRVDGGEVAAYEDVLSRFPRGRIEIRLRQGVSLDVRRVEILESARRSDRPRVGSPHARSAGRIMI